jgi:membrane protein YdbS with pleckstrin-like domain
MPWLTVKKSHSAEFADRPYNAAIVRREDLMFQNPEIALEALPGFDELEWQDLHPHFKRRLRAQFAIVILIVAVAFAIPTFVPGVPLIVVVALWSAFMIVATALMIWPAITVPRRGYVLRDKDIIFRSGVIWRSVTAIPFNRIQHVETSSDPLDRKFELATLQLFTAGGSSGDLRIDGLDKETAEQLRTFILKKVGASIERV